ncbi:hotdog fold thioesterase [Runella salmonicolor]|uniref:Hotdog fold thioesterase n=1 Tax=Runella salmonicolor TaxID=2950278 RepID=A0ABT1FXB8_9BACT|nr:hotdog fold thioesterase [Runella salmonicolor]MCP1386120.1 hotdog fold thioesterase [Runella salmonicolor]
MFNKNIALEQLQQWNKNTIGDHLGIEYLEIGEDYLVARMPVDHRTHQPFGILHGGASVVLAETLGSLSSFLLLPDTTKQQAVGLDINANHIRAVKSGWVYGKSTPLHIGRTTHVWEIRITNEENKLVCISRLTMAIINL